MFSAKNVGQNSKSPGKALLKLFKPVEEADDNNEPAIKHRPSNEKKCKGVGKEGDWKGGERGWVGDHVYEEFHPCLHRWLRDHAQKPPPNYARFIPKPVPENINILAKPLCRRLIITWLRYSEILPDVRRSKLRARLLDCGYSDEDLEFLMAEEKRKAEIKKLLAEAGPFDVFDEEGNLLKPVVRKKKKKGKKKHAKSMEEKPQKKPKKAKCGKGKDEGYKPGKPGQLKPGWPHSIGVNLMLKIWALADSAPDEAYISASLEYFDVQANLLLTLVSEALGISSDCENNISPHMAKIILGCLNLAVWLGQNVTEPAESLPDELIPKMLAMRGGYNKVTSETDKNAETSNVVKQDGKTERKWSEHLPFIMPTRPSEDTEQSTSSSLAEGSPKDNAEVIDAQQTQFLNKAKWYNPLVPEFLFRGPRVEPQNVQFTEVENILLWSLGTVEDMTGQPLTPQEVPPYFPHLRPRIQARADVQHSSPWYVMSLPELYQPEPFCWAATVEMIEMVFDIVHVMVATPNLTMNRLIEMISELCLAIKLTEQDEKVSEEVRKLDDRRTIILETLFINFFSSDFRDFDETTADLMRTVCRRGAVLLRYLYQQTGLTLWDIQQKHAAIPAGPVEGEVVLDPEALEEWHDWLQFLTSTTTLTQKWKEWLQVQESTWHNEPAGDRSEVLSEGNNWLTEGNSCISLANQFEERAHDLKPTLGRPDQSDDELDISNNDEQ